MAPLFLRGLLGLLLAIGLALGLGMVLGKATSYQGKQEALILAEKNVKRIQHALQNERGRLRRRVRKTRRKLRLEFHLCPGKGGQIIKALGEGRGSVVRRPGKGHFLRLPIALAGDASQALCVRIRGRSRRRLLVFGLAGGLGLLIGLGFLLLPLTRRLKRIEKVLHRVAEGDLSARVNDSSKDAVGSLARGVDQIGGRIAALLAAQRQLHASVSHELRTPLARLAVAIDLVQDHPSAKIFDGMRQDVGELDHLVGELLLLARLQDPNANLVLAELDLTKLCSERFETAKRGDGRSLNWLLKAPDGLLIQGDARLLARLIDNLLSNAARHAQTQVQLSLYQDGKHIGLAVEDDGDGIPEAKRQNIFAPFVSVTTGGSAGLGLAICREIADHHHAEIGAESSALGGAKMVLIMG
jgi:signal transduction histidine kinase